MWHTKTEPHSSSRVFVLIYFVNPFLAFRASDLQFVYPIAQRVQKGTDAIIYCRSELDTQWHKDGMLLNKHVDIVFFSNGIALREVRESHAGSYVCVGRAPDGVVFSRASTLTITGELENVYLKMRAR